MNDVVQGRCDARFSKVADALAGEVTAGEELGASIAIDIDGELVVDIWGGYADRAKTVPWAEDTIVNFFSCTKTLTPVHWRGHCHQSPWEARPTACSCWVRKPST